MEIYLLVLFLAGKKVEHPDEFPSKDLCIEHGARIVKEYKEYHQHSRAWFWCFPRYGT